MNHDIRMSIRNIVTGNIDAYIICSYEDGMIILWHEIMQLLGFSADDYDIRSDISASEAETNALIGGIPYVRFEVIDSVLVMKPVVLG
jgi:hypothetical protein